MTSDEMNRRAVKYARSVAWNESHREQVMAAARAWYERNSFAANCSSWRYDQAHYQSRIEYFRARSRAKNDETRKIPYRPRMSRRVPECATCAAHARSMIACALPMSAGTAFANGLKVKGGAR